MFLNESANVSIFGTETKESTMPIVSAANIAFSELISVGKEKFTKGFIVISEDSAAVAALLLSTGRNHLPILKEKNVTRKFDAITVLINIPTTMGAFFLNDRIPARIKEKTMNGKKKPRISLKIVLNV